jgi:hypothetical protein
MRFKLDFPPSRLFQSSPSAQVTPALSRTLLLQDVGPLDGFSEGSGWLFHALEESEWLPRARRCAHTSVAYVPAAPERRGLGYALCSVFDLGHCLDFDPAREVG